MINDLSLSTNKLIKKNTSICIIGAGTAGIFLAQQLRRLGQNVLILESGGKSPISPKEFGHHCIYNGLHYRGAESGRSFGLGGTSVLWGAQMIPLTPSDIDERGQLGISSWPVSYDALLTYFSSVKQALGLPSLESPASEESLHHKHFSTLSQFGEDFQLRLSQWIPFKSRNFAQAFSHILETDPNLEIWLNATVTALHQSPEYPKKISSVTAQCPGGNKLIITPKIVVICAGTLESTRILLDFDELHQGLITQSGSPLGHYFTDHLSISCGKFKCHNWRRYNLETAPIFDRGIMRTPRLEVSPPAQHRLGLTSSFAHFTFITHGDTGFDIIRNILRKRQGERKLEKLKSNNIFAAFNDITAIALWRSLHNRLYIPRQAELLLQIDIEQVPNWDSRLMLSDELDQFGRKRLVIDWRITPEDIRIARTVAQQTKKYWDLSSLSKVADLNLILPEELNNFESLYDVYHPTGTLRMGTNSANSIVNPDLKVWCVDNLYLSTTAVFPSAGSANPGLTHLALTLRLADHLVKQAL